MSTRYRDPPDEYERKKKTESFRKEKATKMQDASDECRNDSRYALSGLSSRTSVNLN